MNKKLDQQINYLKSRGIIDLAIFENRLFCLKYLRNICSHSENVFNRKMTETIKGRNISSFFGKKNNNFYISYFTVLSFFKNLLMPNYNWENKIFKKLNKYEISNELFGIKKETFHSELQGEAWKVLVQPLYKKYIKKSNINKRISMILAVDSKNGLGKNNTLGWRLREDMKYFKKITENTKDSKKTNAVIMGRKTWESIPDKFKPLPGRVNCILSRTSPLTLTPPCEGGELYFNSLKNCLKELEDKKNIENLFIIGGGYLYNSEINNPLLDKIYITKIELDFNCDVFFDGIPDNFELESKSELKEENGIKFRFEVWNRK